MFSETPLTSVFTFLIQSNNQLIIRIIVRLEMLVIRVCLLENTNLIEEHENMFPLKDFFHLTLKSFRMSKLGFFLNKGVTNHK